MKYGIPELCRKSRIGNLTGDEINWVEHQLRHLPYFQLHQEILSLQEHQTPSGIPTIEKGLLYSTNRRAMSALLMQDPDMDLFKPSPENKLPLPSFAMPEAEPVNEASSTPSERDLPSHFVSNETEPFLSKSESSETSPLPSQEAPAHTTTAFRMEAEPSESLELPIQVPDFQSGNEVEDHSALPAPEVRATQTIETPAQELIQAAPAEPRQLSGIELKLDTKIRFRLQMFGWKSVQIRQQMQQMAAASKSESSKIAIRNEKLPNTPLLSWEPTSGSIPEITGTFEPDFSEEPLAALPVAPQEVATGIPQDLPAFIEVEIETPTAEQPSPTLEDKTSEVIADSETETETEDAPGHMTWKHNNMILDIQISGEAEKYLEKKPATFLDSAIQALPRVTEKKTLNFKKRPDRRKVLDIIDKFIESEPEISIRPKLAEGKQEDISRRSVTDEGELVSETLAQIYLKQGNKARAVRIYEALKLKYPEKSAYFESLLQKLG